ncbi:hypothetical protein ACJJTC_001855 [Scirpophaga incertulas]
MVFPRKQFKSFMLNGAPVGTIGLAQPTGWMNSDLFPEDVEIIQKHNRDYNQTVVEREGKSCIPTDTPIKDEIEQESWERERKKLRKGKKKISKKKRNSSQETKD